MPDDRVTCPNCGKHYRWKSQLVGRQVKCSGCESVFEVPDRSPAGQSAGAASGEDYEIDFDEPHPDRPKPKVPPVASKTGAKCPACNSPIKEHALVCINCGFNLQAGARIETEVGKDEDSAPMVEGQAAPARPSLPTDPTLAAAVQASARRRATDESLAAQMEQQHVWKERKMPVILIGVGLGLLVFDALVLQPLVPSFFGTTRTRGQMALGTLINIALLIAIQVPLALFGLFIVAKLFDTSFGPLSVALVKLMSMAAVSDGVNECVGSGLGIMTGGFSCLGYIVQISIALGMFYTLCSYLFDMEPQEIFVLYFLMLLLPSILMMTIM